MIEPLAAKNWNVDGKQFRLDYLLGKTKISALVSMKNCVPVLLSVTIRRLLPQGRVPPDVTTLLVFQSFRIGCCRRSQLFGPWIKLGALLCVGAKPGVKITIFIGVGLSAWPATWAISFSSWLRSKTTVSDLSLFYKSEKILDLLHEFLNSGWSNCSCRWLSCDCLNVGWGDPLDGFVS